MKTTGSGCATSDARQGVALIICLGLLSVMTLLAVAFSIAMRVERMAARNFADGVRAKHLVHAAFARAMLNLDAIMVRRIVPPSDAWASATGGGGAAELLTDQARDLLPGGDLRNLTEAAALTSRWITDGIPGGKVAYLIVNTSGLLDMNNAGGWPRGWSTNLHEVDIEAAPEFHGDISVFLGDRSNYRRFENIDELDAICDSIDGPAYSFNTFSYDPAPDMVFLNTDNPGLDWWESIEETRPPPTLGTRAAERYLHEKFNVNSITNFDSYNGAPADLDRYRNDPEFMANYFEPLTSILRQALPEADAGRPDDVAWNIINYLDPDRIPQGGDAVPWTHSEGGEAIPLINELVITGGSNGAPCQLHVELWYPFAPTKVKPDDNFKIKVMIFDQREINLPELQVENSPFLNATYSFEEPIPHMEYGTADEFLVFKTDPITFPNGKGFDGTNKFYFLVRVLQDNIPVDEAMGYRPGDDWRRQLFEVTEPRGYGLHDPRSNGQVKYWYVDPRDGVFIANNSLRNGMDYPPGENTLGAFNDNVVTKPGWGDVPLCDPWNRDLPGISGKGGHGVPIYATNGLMRNIGEIGNIWQSNLDDEEAPTRPFWFFWRNINLMRRSEGAMLMDMLCVREPRYSVTGGVFAASSRVTNAWRTIWGNLRIGVPGVVGADLVDIPPARQQNLIRKYVETVTARRFVSYADMFTDEISDDGGGGELADAFRECPPNWQDACDIYREDTLRHMLELISFRQNIFTIVMGAQVLSPKGNVVVAERRAIAEVYRDTYTGRHFTRSFRWLDD